MAKLTKRIVENIAPELKDRIIHDDSIAGFGLRVSPAGRKRFVVQYRIRGRQRRVTLGVFGIISCDEARKRAKEILGAVAGGKDPAENRTKKSQAATVNMLAERFLDEHVANHCKPRTSEEYGRVLRLHVLPAFGTSRIADVKRPDVANFHFKLRKTPYQANRSLAVLSKMFGLAETWGLRAEGSNPCQRIRKYPEQKKERYLDKGELSNLLDVLDQRHSDGLESFSVISAFKLLIFTGCRLSEVQFLKWANVKNGMLELPDSKTGARRIPLSEPAKNIITSMPRALHSKFVFWADGPKGYITDFQKPWRRVRSQAGLSEVRIHDLRHTYASLAVQDGIPLQLVGKLLGHKQLQTTLRYAHLADENVRAAAQAVGAILSHATDEQRGEFRTGAPLSGK